MKLTICQIGKLFLLLTAFFLLLDSQQLVGVHCIVEKVAIERLNALDADTTGELTTVTAIEEAQNTTNANVTAVRAVIVDKVCTQNNKNNHSQKRGQNNSGQTFDICVEEQSQPQENARNSGVLTTAESHTIFEYTITTTKATTSKRDYLLYAPSIGQHRVDALMSTAESAELQQSRAEAQDVAQTHKLITTTPTNQLVDVIAGTATVATTKQESVGKLSGGKNVADNDTTSERRNQQKILFNVEQQRLQQLQGSAQASEQQQVQTQAQREHQKEQIHRPRQQFDPIQQPLATKATTENHTTTTLSTSQARAHLSTEMKKLLKFPTKMAQQQLPKQQQQQQQQRQKSANKENGSKMQLQQEDAKPEIRKQRKRKPLEVVLRQQQKLQQQHSAQPQFFTLKPLPTRSRQPQQNGTVWQQHVDEQLQQDAQHVPEHEPLRQQPSHSTVRHQHVGVLIPSRILDVLHVQQGFYNFLDFFHVNLQNVSVDFIRDDGKYSEMIYILTIHAFHILTTVISPQIWVNQSYTQCFPKELLYYLLHYQLA